MCIFNIYFNMYMYKYVYIYNMYFFTSEKIFFIKCHIFFKKI